MKIVLSCESRRRAKGGKGEKEQRRSSKDPRLFIPFFPLPLCSLSAAEVRAFSPAFPALRRGERRLLRGYLLVEMLVYISVLLVILAVGYAAMYRGADSSAALRHNTRDIANALHAGERWRADVRKTRGQPRLETTPAGQVLHLRQSTGEVAYLFSTNTVFRRVGTGAWSTVLDNVQASALTSDRRRNVTAWQWELELQTRKKKLNRVRPLFTFIAVPAGNSNP